MVAGLHLIDFEQLKIENQTLNEKIEERNEELHKLRKKTITTVQIVTHMREKLQFIQQENQVLKIGLGPTWLQPHGTVSPLPQGTVKNGCLGRDGL